MQFSWEVNKKVLGMLFRYVLVILGGLLVRHGVIDQATADAWLTETTAILVGAVLIAGPIVWRWVYIRYDVKKLIVALLQEPPANPTPANVEKALNTVKQEAATVAVSDLPTRSIGDL